MKVEEKDNGACALFHEQIVLHIMDEKENQKVSEPAFNFIVKCLETNNWLVMTSVLRKVCLFLFS